MSEAADIPKKTRKCDGCGKEMEEKEGWIHYNDANPEGNKAETLCQNCHDLRWANDEE